MSVAARGHPTLGALTTASAGAPAPTGLRRRRLAAWLLSPCLASGGGLGLQAPLARAAAGVGAPFEPTITLGDHALLLNGSGTRVRANQRFYDLGLYTTRRVRTVAELLALPGPKRLHFIAVHELPGTDLGRLFFKGLGDNVPRDVLNRHLPAMTRFIEIFSARSRLMPGDTFSMDFIPGKGTQFTIQGQAQGGPVGDDEFFTLVLRIWVGDNVSDPPLKNALLGLAPG